MHMQPCDAKCPNARSAPRLAERRAHKCARTYLHIETFTYSSLLFSTAYCAIVKLFIFKNSGCASSSSTSLRGCRCKKILFVVPDQLELQKSPALPPQYLDSYVNLFRLRDLRAPPPPSPSRAKTRAPRLQLIKRLVADTTVTGAKNNASETCSAGPLL